MQQRDKAVVDIVCPKCSNKAQYKAPWNNSYIQKPSNEGLLTCVYCGLAKKSSLSELKYYYSIEIGNRHLVARNRINLLKLYFYFKEGYKTEKPEEPDFDFPKVFYKKRKELLLKIEKKLNLE